MGGKTGTSTSTVQIPPEVLARYNAVNAQAQQVAGTPFQPYTGEFVAPLTPTQQAGISATSRYSQLAQPYYQAATSGAVAGGQAVNPNQLNISQFMSPYTSQVAEATANMLRQQQGQQTTQQQANAIMSGAFGGDRSNLAAAQLAGQQQLAMAQAMAPIYQQGYGQALQAAQQQQGVYLSADQANRAAQQQMAAQLAGLGTGAQQAALQGAQAQIGAGTLQQQTQQAQDTALYQQFLQERGYPFQVAQFLANIAMGTGALSGSTTTSQYPMPFFSDRRLKEDVKEIGETHDGQPIYSFKYKGKPGTQIGLMAQDVEKRHPDAVYETEGGIKAVDYKAATKGAEMAAGGIVPEGSMGGAVFEPGSYGRGGYEIGGEVDPNSLAAILASQKAGFGPFGGQGPYGQGPETSPYGGKGIVPAANLPVAKLLQAETKGPPKDTGVSQVQSALDMADKLGQDASKVKSGITSFADWFKSPEKDRPEESHGGVVPRGAYALAGSVTKKPVIPGQDTGMDYFPEDILDVNTASNQQDAPKTPQPQSGASGLSSAIGLGSALLGLFLKDGGVVPRKHFEFGGLSDRGYGDEPYDPNTPDELQLFTKSKASEYGLDPEHAARVVRGESNFNPAAVGDEGSSFGPMQLHYGNISEKYPHPGLGDEFTKQTGLDARDPKNARAAIDWSLNYVAQDPSRWKNWTVARNMMQDSNSPMRGATPAGGIVPPTAAEEIPSEDARATSSGGLTDYLRENQGWMVPLGGFLKGMVQSRSPFLGGALLEGIGGGLEAVGPAQRQLLEQKMLAPVVTQRQVTTMNELTNGWLNYKATSGQDISLEDYAKMVGYTGPIVSPRTAKAASGVPITKGVAEPVETKAPQFSYDINELRTAVLDRDGAKIQAMNDPAYLQEFISRNSGTTSTYIKGQVEAAKNTLDKIKETGQTLDVNGNAINAPGKIAAKREAELGTNVTANIANKYTEANQFEAAYDNSRNLLDAIAEYSKLADMNKATPELASAIGRLRSIPGFDKFITPEMSTIQGAADATTKAAITGALQTVAESGSNAQKAILNEAIQTIARPDLSPEARQEIVAKALGRLERERQRNSDWLSTGGKDKKFEDPLTFNSGWNRDPANSLEKYVEKARKEVGLFKGQKAILSGPESGTVAPQPVENQEGVSASGKPIVWRNGRWVYK